MIWLSAHIYKTYLSILIVIGLYSLHKVSIVWRFYRYKHNVPQPYRYFSDGELPPITVQLPIFNEINVVERLLDAVAQLNYPPEKLEIQVLDDSLDETQQLCRSKVEALQAQNLNIHYIHRIDRTGFKAGALEHGLTVASGELVMIFDADFVPEPDTLLKMVHYFSDPRLGMVQARWGHVNRHYSRMTEVQALMLDGHFVTEQTARNRSGCFFNFNGTAGIWRIDAIADAGGWQHSTVTEDLDLSYRAQLRGWKCIYIPDIVVPAELPMELNSFKAQQFRWAKGASQVAKKLLFPVLASDLPFSVKGEAFLHLTNNFNYLLLLVLLLLSLPYQMYLTQAPWQHGVFIHLPLFIATTFSLLGFYFVSIREQALELSPWQFIKSVILLMSIGIGMSINQSLAVGSGLLGGGADFVRTPKHGVVSRQENWKSKKYRAARNLVPYLELFMAAYLTITIGIAVSNHHFLSIPFLALFWSGFVYVLVLGVSQRR